MYILKYKYMYFKIYEIINRIFLRNRGRWFRICKKFKKLLIKNFDQGVHDHDMLVDIVHIGGKMQIF